MKLYDDVTCEITGIQPYGIFVVCEDYEGLIHISELSDQFLYNIESLFKIGDSISAKIIEIDENDKRLRLSYKQAHPIPKKISKQITIKLGFHTLEQNLPKWIKEYYDNEKN